MLSYIYSKVLNKMSTYMRQKVIIDLIQNIMTNSNRPGIKGNPIHIVLDKKWTDFKLEATVKIISKPKRLKNGVYTHRVEVV